MNPENERKERLKRLSEFLEELCRQKEVSMGQLSTELFNDRFKLYNFTKKEKEPSLPSLKILFEQGLNIEWLLTGKGKMMK